MFKEIFISFLIIIIAIWIGIWINDKIVGTLILSSGMLNIWLAVLNKNYNYIFGGIFYLLNAYVSYVNGLYGIAFLSLFVYFHLQIDGFIRWKDDNPIKKLSIHISIFIIICLITSTLGFSLLLHKIPSQSLSILDAGSNIANICGIILMNLRYREAWVLWLINNIIDLLIWIMMCFRDSSNALMMLIVSIGYLVMNIYGIIMWRKSKV